MVLQHHWGAKLMMLHHCSAKNLNDIPQQPWMTLQQIPPLTTGPIHPPCLWLTLEKILLQSLVPQHSRQVMNTCLLN